MNQVFEKLHYVTTIMYPASKKATTVLTCLAVNYRPTKNQSSPNYQFSPNETKKSCHLVHHSLITNFHQQTHLLTLTLKKKKTSRKPKLRNYYSVIIPNPNSPV